MTEQRWSEMFPEKVPVKLTPAEAFAARMEVRDYAKLEHGRLHRDRVEELKRLWNEWRASTVDNPDAPLTRRDLALFTATMYDGFSSYSMNTQAQVAAGVFYEHFSAMGGKLR